MLSQKLIDKIQKEVDSYDLSIDWRSEQLTDKDMISKVLNGQGDLVRDELFEWNLDYLCELENQARINAVEEFQDEIMEELGIEDYNNFYAKDIAEDIAEGLVVSVDVGLEKLLRQTDVPVRLTLYSNYDCMNSAWLESQGGIEYDGYLKDAIDFLKLNPAKLKLEFIRTGYQVIGRWPNKRERDDRELIEYSEFISEFANTASSANLLTILGTLNLLDVYKNPNPKRVFIPKGANVGFFDSTYGGGSMFEATTKRDVWMKLGPRKGKSEYDSLDIDPDIDSYNTRDVYGWDRSFFTDIDIAA